MGTLAEQFRLNYIEEGIEIGKKIGREEGREEGRVENTARAVRNLMSRGYSLEEALDIVCLDNYRSRVISRLNESDIQCNENRL